MHKFEKEMLELGVEMYRSMGLDDLSSRLIILAYMEPEAISLEELARKTGYSLALVSNKMKFLEGMRIVQRVRKPGTKKAYFYMDKNIIKIQKRKIDVANEKWIKPVKEKVPKLLEKYKNEKMNEKEKKKLQLLKNYYEQIKKLEVLMNRFEREIEKLEKEFSE